MLNTIKKFLPAKYKAVIDLFYAGKKISNPAAWKKGQVAVSAVHSVLWLGTTDVLYFTGYEVPITGEGLDALSAYIVTAVPAIVGVYDVVSTVITSDTVGLQHKSKPSGDDGTG